jgi:hypothetical protein
MIGKILALVLILLCLAAQSSYAAGLILLPRTGQTKCYSAGESPTAGSGLKGGTQSEIPCAGTGQDGEIQAGVAWPEPRFTVDEYGCITDHLTGLMWLVNIYIAPELPWDAAIDTVTHLIDAYVPCGYSDWRAPNVVELASLQSFGVEDNGAWLGAHGFVFPSGAGRMWSSTTNAASTDEALAAGLASDMDVTNHSKSNTDFRVLWAVRGASDGPASLWRTGQTESYRAQDDGHHRAGVAWPSPRFKDLGNDTVVDNLTGLLWTKDANGPGPAACDPGWIKSWQEALDYVKCLNDSLYLNYRDWRLPNRTELLSLIDRSRFAPALPEDHPFLNVQFYPYWSSTTNPANHANAFFVWIGERTYLYHVPKTVALYVWPVRGPLTDSAVTIEKAGTGTGTVTSDPEGISCGDECTHVFSGGSVVTLTAKANKGYRFTGWSGGACSGTAPCVMAAAGDVTITAVFSPPGSINVSPASVNFGSVKIGSFSTPRAVAVKNKGPKGSLLHISSISLSGQDKQFFSYYSTGCDAPLGYNASCVITTTFQAYQFGVANADLNIVSDDPKKAKTVVKLKGTGVAPKASVSPGTINFGTTPLGKAATFTKTATIRNNGLGDLIIQSVMVEGGSFSQTNACGTIAHRASCPIEVVFSPSGPGKKTGILKVMSNDPSPKRSVITISLTGKTKATQ